MERLDLYSIAFERTWLIEQQIRLLRKHLLDDFRYTVVDNSRDEASAQQIHALCGRWGVCYRRSPSATYSHHDALNFAATHARNEQREYIGFLDHDIFPTEPTSLIPLIDEAGFYGVGQRHGPSGHLYLWPGFCFFKRDWLGDRRLNFDGIRGDTKRDDGDTGSANWPLFAEEGWEHLYKPSHGYKAIREPDSYGLQSWGYEVIGPWVHFSNGSHWMTVPSPHQRDQLLANLLAEL